MKVNWKRMKIIIEEFLGEQTWGYHAYVGDIKKANDITNKLRYNLKFWSEEK